MVFGDASGAEEDNNPAINLIISETSVFSLKLLKYEPSMVPQSFEVGSPTLTFSACSDLWTLTPYFSVIEPSGESKPLPDICKFSAVP